MTILYVAIEKALAVVSQRNGEWGVDLHLLGSQPQCLAVDPLHQEQVYCGTFDQGLWQSTDAGASWRPDMGGPQARWSIRYPHPGHTPARAQPVVLGGRRWFYATGQWLCAERRRRRHLVST